MVGIAFDCQENRVYWTDLSARTISRASLAPGAEPETLISTSAQDAPFLPHSSPAAHIAKPLISTFLSPPTSPPLPRPPGRADLVSPEGLAVDVKRRLMFWVDSNPDVIESSNLDGSGRRTLFDTELVNPRAIIVVSSTG